MSRKRKQPLGEYGWSLKEILKDVLSVHDLMNVVLEFVGQRSYWILQHRYISDHPADSFNHIVGLGSTEDAAVCLALFEIAIWERLATPLDCDEIYVTEWEEMTAFVNKQFEMRADGAQIDADGISWKEHVKKYHDWLTDHLDADQRRQLFLTLCEELPENEGSYPIITEINACNDEEIYIDYRFDNIGRGSEPILRIKPR